MLKSKIYLKQIFLVIPLLFVSGEVWGGAIEELQSPQSSGTAAGVNGGIITQPAFEDTVKRHAEVADVCVNSGSELQSTSQKFRTGYSAQQLSITKNVTSLISGNGAVNEGAAVGGADTLKLGNNRKVTANEVVSIARKAKGECAKALDNITKDIELLRNTAVQESISASLPNGQKVPEYNGTKATFDLLVNRKGHIEASLGTFDSAINNGVAMGIEGVNDGVTSQKFGDVERATSAIGAGLPSGTQSNSDDDDSNLLGYGLAAAGGGLLGYMLSDDGGGEDGEDGANGAGGGVNTPGSEAYCEHNTNYRDPKCSEHFMAKCEADKSGSGCTGFTEHYCVTGSRPGKTSTYCDDYLTDEECRIASQKETRKCEDYFAEKGIDPNTHCPTNVSNRMCNLIGQAYTDQGTYNDLLEDCTNNDSVDCQYFQESFANRIADNGGGSGDGNGDGNGNAGTDGTVIVYDQGCTSAFGCGGGTGGTTNSQSTNNGGRGTAGAYRPNDVGTVYASSNDHVVNQAVNDICRDQGMYSCPQ